MDVAALLPSLLILGGLISASAFFSGTEVAMFSLRRVDKEQMARSEKSTDRLILSLLSRPDRLIATLLLGNEFVNVSVSAIMAGVTGRIFSDRGEVELALISTLIAVPLLLFFGEITPKTVAINTATGWSRRAARLLWFFGLVVTPLRIVIRTVANGLIRPFGSTKVKPTEDLGEDEFKALVDAGRADGEVDAQERELIHRVFEFGDKAVADVMLVRSEVFALSYELPKARLVAEVAEHGYSRVPIFQRSLDNIRGILYAKDLVIQGVGGSGRLSDLLHRPLFVPQTVPIKKLFRIFKERKIHMALVVNEYGKIAGLCTMEDLLEELFGEILDEREESKARAAVRGEAARGRKRGRAQ